MTELQTLVYKDDVILKYKYIPVVASGNRLTPTRYRTQIYLANGSSLYDLGWIDEHLDEEEIKARFEETLQTNQERQYGQQQGTFLRRELSPRRERGKVGLRNFGTTRRHF